MKHPKIQAVSVNRQTIRDYSSISWRFKRDVLLSLFILGSGLLLNTFVPLFTGKTLAALSRPHASTTPYVLYLSTAAILGVLTNFIGFQAWTRLQPKVLSVLEENALTVLLNRSTSFHNNRISGKLITDSVAYANSFINLSNSLIMGLLPLALSMVVGIVIISLSSWVLGILVTTMTVAIVGVTYAQTKRFARYRQRRHEARRNMVAHLSDTVINNQTVKTFAGESYELDTHKNLNTTLRDIRTLDWNRVSADGSKRIAVLLAFEIGFVVLIIKLVSDNPSLLGIGIFAFSYALNLGNKLFDLGGTFQTIENALLEASDLTQIIHERPEIVNKPDAPALTVAPGQITFNHVSFAYSDNKKAPQVFSDLNLTIKPGERVGLVGPSGGGKSTFTRLLLRFDDIQSGSIVVDKQNITDVTQESLRRAISYVPQEPLLFHRTIAENIAYGTPATEAEIVEAAKKAYAHDFIQDLPKGLDTIVGERGVKLSGGQRQRIAIARAVLKNAPILVLDEATSALDSESEVYIQTALWDLMRDRTALVIAHRLSTIQKLDRILVLVDGKIVEDGSHAALLKQKGIYAKLWSHQSGGFIED